MKPITTWDDFEKAMRVHVPETPSHPLIDKPFNFPPHRIGETVYGFKAPPSFRVIFLEYERYTVCCSLYREPPLSFNIPLEVYLYRSSRKKIEWRFGTIPITAWKGFRPQPETHIPFLWVLCEVVNQKYKKQFLGGRGCFHEFLDTLDKIDHLLMKLAVHPDRDRVFPQWSVFSDIRNNGSSPNGDGNLEYYMDRCRAKVDRT